jgi:hypothetical protein
LGSALLVLACEFVSCGGDAKRTLGEEIKTYPVSFGGSATVSTPYDAATCVRQGTAVFVAGDDETCALNVSFPMTYTDINGQCVNNGDTQAWLLKGTFKKGFQVCHFETCNDSAAYYASGTLKFFPQETAATSLQCSLEEGGELRVTIELPVLKP